MKIWKISITPSPTHLKEIIEVLEGGGMVVYPTETCYGLGVDATNDQAVDKLLKYKGGRQNKAVSVAVADEEMASGYVEINEMARHLFEQFFPGPVTVISKSKGKVAPALESDRGTLGIRMPDNEAALSIVKAFGRPITATSANTSGKKSPYSLADLEKYTSQVKLHMIDGFVDVGPLPYREPSTVVDTTLNELEVVREGSIKLGEKAKQKVTRSPLDTQNLAMEIMKECVDKLSTMSVVFALQGELGAGKTQFVKGLAKALGITQIVSSPTYQIMREYDYRCGKLGGKLVHIDTWRLHEGGELEDLGLKEYLMPGNVVAIEWMQKARELMGGLGDVAEMVWVTIEEKGEDVREVRWC